MTIKKKYLFVVLPLLLIVLLLVFALRNSRLNASLDVEVTPSKAGVKLNGKNTDHGLTKVAAGTFKVEVSMKGFETISKTVRLAKGERKYIGIILNPNSSDTQNWYLDNASDQKKAEGISSKNFDQNSKSQRELLPIIKILPFIDQFYRIDYGVSSNAPNDPSRVALYVTYYSEQGKQDAIDFLKFKRVDIEKTEIIYKPGGGQEGGL